jgi:hypothetical protein
LVHALLPIILFCQIRDFLYTRMHFTFKASYVFLVHSLKNGTRRGVSGLARALAAAKLEPASNISKAEGVDALRAALDAAGANIVRDTVDVGDASAAAELNASLTGGGKRKLNV